MDKRGQLTIFVILGLALLLVIGLALLFLRSDSPAQQTGGISTQEVVSYLESCINTHAKEAVLIAGRQGGKINFEGLIVNEPAPWLSDVVKSGPQEVPYWYHLKSCEGRPYGCIEFTPPPLCREGECTFDAQYTGAPKSIQEEIEDYLKEKTPLCVSQEALDNFDIIQEGSPQPLVTITSEDLLVQVNLPVSVRNTETREQTRLDSFSTRLDVDLAETYLLAREVLALQYTTNFVEENFLQFLSTFQGDPPNPPPFEDSDFLAGEKFWSRTQVEQQLQNEILPFMNFMQVMNAYEGYSPIINTLVDAEEEYQQYARGLFEYAEINLPGRSYPDHGVSFLYPHSNIYLNINDQEVLRGQDLSGHNFFMKLAGVFITRYSFDYDVAFPLLTTIDDPNAFGGEGFQFTFGLEGNIVNNFPMHDARDISIIDTQSSTSRGFSNQVASHHHVQDSTINVQVRDRQSNSPVSDAVITYECGWRYVAGTTDDTGQWSGTLPYCPVGGYIEAEVALDYFFEREAFNNDEAGDHQLTIDLWPYAEKEVNVLKRPIFEETILPTGENITTILDTCLEPEPLSWGGEVEEVVTLLNETYVVDPDDPACDEWNCTTEVRTSPDNQHLMLIMQYLDLGADSRAALTPIPSVTNFGSEGETTQIDAFDALSLAEDILESGNITQEEFDVIESSVQQGVAQQISLSEKQTINLIPGRYSFDGMLFYDGLLHIPEERRRTGSWPFRRTITLPELNLSMWQQGGVQTEFEILPEDLYSNRDLIVHVVEKPLPRTWKTLERDSELDMDTLNQEYSQCMRVFFE